MELAVIDRKTSKADIKRLICIYYLEFMSFGFIGWTYETIYTSICWGRFAERGFLHIPVCPIYGFVSFIILLVLNRFKNSIPLLFVLSTLLVGSFEYLASFILEKFFNLKLWDYSYLKYHINGRVSVVICICFGIACVFLVKVLNPFLYKIYSKIKKKPLYIVSAILFLITFADTVYTIITTE